MARDEPSIRDQGGARTAVAWCPHVLGPFHAPQQVSTDSCPPADAWCTTCSRCCAADNEHWRDILPRGCCSPSGWFWREGEAGIAVSTCHSYALDPPRPFSWRAIGVRSPQARSLIRPIRCCLYAHGCPRWVRGAFVVQFARWAFTHGGIMMLSTVHAREVGTTIYPPKPPIDIRAES